MVNIKELHDYYYQLGRDAFGYVGDNLDDFADRCTVDALIEINLGDQNNGLRKNTQ